MLFALLKHKGSESLDGAILNCVAPYMVVEGQRVLLFAIRESITVLFGQQIN